MVIFKYHYSSYPNGEVRSLWFWETPEQTTGNSSCSSGDEAKSRHTSSHTLPPRKTFCRKP
ncbi:MAG: hypothetical protein ACK5N2_03165 [bacterium]